MASGLLQVLVKEGRRTNPPKRCGNNSKDEVNSPKTLNDKNHPNSSQKFRQLLILVRHPKIMRVGLSHKVVS